MKKKYVNKAIRKTAVRSFRYPKRIAPKPEMKIIDTVDTGFSIGSTAKIDLLCNVSQGTAVNTRVGTKVNSMNILGRLEFIHNPSAVATFIRMFIFQDTQQVLATTPGSISILQTTDTRSALNIQNRGRFKILKDELFSLNNFDKSSKEYKIYLKVPLPIQWSDNSGTNIQKNGLYVFFLSSDNTNQPLGSYNFRYSFNDS